MRLIDADILLDKLYDHEFITLCPLDEVSDVIDYCPTVEAEPVRHGQWEKMGEADYKCSVCGFRFTTADHIEMFPYCRCGAKMDEEVR